MQRLEVRGAVRPIYGSLGVKRLMNGNWLNWLNSFSNYSSFMILHSAYLTNLCPKHHITCWNSVARDLDIQFETGQIHDWFSACLSLHSFVKEVKIWHYEQYWAILWYMACDKQLVLSVGHHHSHQDYQWQCHHLRGASTLETASVTLPGYAGLGKSIRS